MFNSSNFLPRIFVAVKVSCLRRDILICNSRSNATKNIPMLPYLLFSSLNCIGASCVIQQ